MFKHKVEDDYNIINEINNLSLTGLQEIQIKTGPSSAFAVVGENIPDEKGVTTLYLVEDKKTLRRYNAFCISFRREKHAVQYCESIWKQRIDLNHENIVPIVNMYLQKNDKERYQLFIVKVCGFFAPSFCCLLMQSHQQCCLPYTIGEIC